MPAYRTYERVEQEVEPDEDVRAVQTCQAIEGRSEVEIRGPNPIRVYSLAWIRRKVRPSPKVSASPPIRPARLFILIDWSAQCIVKTRSRG